MVLDTSLFNTQQYKVRIKGKMEQSRERSSAPLHLGVVATEKGAFWSLSTTVAYLLIQPFLSRTWKKDYLLSREHSVYLLLDSLPKQG